MREVLRGSVPSSTEACEALVAWLGGHPSLRTVAVYAPLPGEIDLSQAIRARPDLHWIYPKVRGHELSFHEGSNLIAGAFGILEPADGSAEVPLESIDAFVCPGLAFDGKGGRLGRGKGFYDRMLEKARDGALKIGVCHSFQMVENTFAEPHDIHMDVVLRG